STGSAVGLGADCVGSTVAVGSGALVALLSGDGAGVDCVVGVADAAAVVATGVAGLSSSSPHATRTRANTRVATIDTVLMIACSALSAFGRTRYSLLAPALAALPMTGCSHPGKRRWKVANDDIVHATQCPADVLIPVIA